MKPDFEKRFLEVIRGKLESWSYINPKLPCLGSPYAVNELAKSFTAALEAAYEDGKRDVGDVYYNEGTAPIFITTEFKTDPNGGPAINKTEYCVAPGDGIDLSILGLRNSAALKTTRG